MIVLNIMNKTFVLKFKCDNSLYWIHFETTMKCAYFSALVPNFGSASAWQKYTSWW